MFHLEEIKKVLQAEQKFRLRQALKAIYQQGIESWDELSVFSKDLREKLKKDISLEIKAKSYETSDKKTIKVVFDFGKNIEAVLMCHQGRNTVCVSTQIGCSMACDFCYSGKFGLERNLSEDEIILQVLYFNRLLKKENSRVSNVVFMGMGEPFANYNNVLGAIKILNDKELFNIGARHISVSTSGLVPGIKKLAKEKLQINLSVSLHASSDEVRDKIMPINKTYNIDTLLEATRNYIKQTRRRVMIEYVMLAGINDSPKDANELTKLLKEKLGDLFFVNIIKYNSTGEYESSPKNKIEVFKRILIDEGIDVVERYRFGKDIKAACGQLAKEENKK
ncbi:23S rRNA (adenine(2503)-C(2))-methyltransferase RlmN [Candidatus Parcubacteria bacterium]|mgnify:CR=1 FL=1|nr:MAG: 23S rRNA (adenine(2503)-C(2))-methyltransferase RlmN [Candidatus Parcubacteria bacterium]